VVFDKLCLRIKILQISKGQVAKHFCPPINIVQETELGLTVSRVFPVSGFSLYILTLSEVVLYAYYFQVPGVGKQNGLQLQFNSQPNGKEGVKRILEKYRTGRLCSVDSLFIALNSFTHTVHSYTATQISVLYSALLHLPPLRFHCADEYWDRTQDRCN
jgi:hypothetical protein